MPTMVVISVQCVRMNVHYTNAQLRNAKRVKMLYGIMILRPDAGSVKYVNKSVNNQFALNDSVKTLYLNCPNVQ